MSGGLAQHLNLLKHFWYFWRGCGIELGLFKPLTKMCVASKGFIPAQHRGMNEQKLLFLIGRAP